ncbi:peptide-methionine (S)-S-oxide reductase [Paenibacillus shirakamiensis]|uniref:Peptide methionine sulfoxide reductase MsrA n=1 Tax=Paenibacillus shirakamiensis TaxID=1265935 RepID=A0ABS4JBH8_9BACL|nr:peptide-methionine (S)-S-oxide reductase [Paenibacillus shirakamiensis]MBP1999067.1 peptide-methionine (S)-S-oxide reductase [Paenibacillus shirakamiensis]
MQFPEHMLPRTETITLAMGCFWSPDALFGHLPGVVRTRTGYAGGTTPLPTYRNMGDHSESLEIDYDPEIISLKSLIHLFWNSHQPLNINDYKGRQYQSLLFYRDDYQQEVSSHVIHERLQQGHDEPATEVLPYEGFELAEERHQKYYLKRFPDALATMLELYPSLDRLTDSTLAARLNGLAKGFTNRERIIAEIEQWPLPLEERERRVYLIKSIKW